MPTLTMSIEVQWGVIPGTAEGQKQWHFSATDLENADNWDDLFTEAFDEYRKRSDPRINNWTTITWIWY